GHGRYVAPPPPQPSLHARLRSDAEQRPIRQIALSRQPELQHASLHNLDEIQRLDVREGDSVVLFKAGDIIPKIKNVLKELRPRSATSVKPPTQCPVCGSKIERQKGEVAMYCTNKRCFSQDKEAILHAARAFGIDGIGPQTIAALLERKIINRPSDLFSIQPDDLLVVEGFAELSSKKLVEEIQTHKEISLANFLLSLGIRNVGEQTAIDLANAFGSLEKLVSVTLEGLEKVEGVGGVVAKSVKEFFSEQRNIDLVSEYTRVGVKVHDEKQSLSSGVFSGKTLVLTGTLETLSRDEAKNKIDSEEFTILEPIPPSSLIEFKKSFKLQRKAYDTLNLEIVNAVPMID
ncbi:MAG: helix-hairpin-helix domain-containing protein, partial [Bacteroidota bacterium]